jgi:hypothetical protein
LFVVRPLARFSRSPVLAFSQRLKMSYWLELFHHKLRTHHEAQHNITAAADAAAAAAGGAEATPATPPGAEPAQPQPQPQPTAVDTNSTASNNVIATNATTTPARRHRRHLLREPSPTHTHS